ncbi:MAG: AIR carboxylase family protein [Candidatus Bathyarchaeota archaeon]|nr:5-(carboxyamino)imidazole ribonucleotide mutase [Candidatus Bathyarchaeum tardum]WGM89483.1 MAG: 5-(carboxyamino)imidazole ribonucleotide mutase [Candidatus Bathyarchaeum tardum]WNZ28243.1 MAG: AIR carboxylase family protein [Candidatus Bathyarchaeota archaeon]
MSKEQIVVLMGSPRDLPFASKIKEFLEKQKFPVDCVYTVASAHRTPEKLLKELKEYEKCSVPLVYITVAGLSDALSGVVAGTTVHPVIACPPDSDQHGGAKVFSSTAMPTGVPVAYVVKPENAALVALRIFAIANPELQKSLDKYNKKMAKAIYDGDEEVKKVTQKKHVNRLAV